MRRVGILASVSSPDLYPLILCGGITIQGIVFAVAQSRGLDGFAGRGCTLISQAVLPALLLVPVIQFVLGVEIAMRGMKATPFPERGRWMVSLCLAIIGLITLINFLVADFIRARDFCFKSLFWFVMKWAQGIFVLLAVFAITLMGAAVFVFLRLARTPKIDPTERVNASRMIFFMALAVISNAFMCPFFFVLAFMKTPDGEAPKAALNLSMVAAVVANLSGLMTGGLHLFLRSSSIPTTISPRDKWEENERMSLKNKIRLRGFASSPDFNGQMMEPVGRPLRGRSSSTANLMAHGKEEEARLESVTPTYPVIPHNAVGTHALFPLIATAIQVPQPVQISSIEVPKAHMQKGSNYTLFPSKGAQTSADTKSVLCLLPSTTYNPDEKKSPAMEEGPADRYSMLKPPPPLKPVGRHVRNSSMASSATVQIGLRLSNVEDMPSINPKYLNDGGQTHHLDCPLAIKSAQETSKRSPLSNIHMTGDDSDDDTVFDHDSATLVVPLRDPVKDARMKTLPPVPMPGMKQQQQQQEEDDDEDQVRLSPTVYTPESATPRVKLPSPRGVGFQPPPPKRSDTPGNGEGKSSSSGSSQWI